MISDLENALIKNQADFHLGVNFDPAKEKLFQFDFTNNNKVLGASEIADTNLFDGYTDRTLKANDATYGIGGYKENRTLYRRSNLFAGEEARSMHLGIDIWGPLAHPCMRHWVAGCIVLLTTIILEIMVQPLFYCISLMPLLFTPFTGI